MIRMHEDGELRVGWSWNLVWTGLGAGALLGLVLTASILGAALLGPILNNL